MIGYYKFIQRMFLTDPESEITFKEKSKVQLAYYANSK